MHEGNRRAAGGTDARRGRERRARRGGEGHSTPKVVVCGFWRGARAGRGGGARARARWGTHLPPVDLRAVCLVRAMVTEDWGRWVVSRRKRERKVRAKTTNNSPLPFWGPDQPPRARLPPVAVGLAAPSPRAPLRHDLSERPWDSDQDAPPPPPHERPATAPPPPPQTHPHPRPQRGHGPTSAPTPARAVLGGLSARAWGGGWGAGRARLCGEARGGGSGAGQPRPGPMGGLQRHRSRRSVGP